MFIYFLSIICVSTATLLAVVVTLIQLPELSKCSKELLYCTQELFHWSPKNVALSKSKGPRLMAFDPNYYHGLAYYWLKNEHKQSLFYLAKNKEISGHFQVHCDDIPATGFYNTVLH